MLIRRNMKMKYYIKNMVSLRCKMAVREELEKINQHHAIIELGHIQIKKCLSNLKRNELKLALLKSGLELMDDQNAVLVEKIKMTIIEMVHYEDELPKGKKSVYISRKLNHDYNHLARLFSEVNSTSIEHYFITQKIERIKELIIYDELSLSEIAFKLHYSSVSHLCKQFKKATGLTPTFFKSLNHKMERPERAEGLQS